MIIGISGKAGAGKDTFASALANQIFVWADHYAKDLDICRFSQKIYDVAAILTGTPVHIQETQEGKAMMNYLGMTNGQLQQLIGTEIGRAIHPDIWIKALAVDYTPKKLWIIPSVRFENEFQWIRNISPNNLLIRIEGDPTGMRKHPTRDWSHTSETALDHIVDWDVVIKNDGTLEDLVGHALLISATVLNRIRQMDRPPMATTV